MTNATPINRIEIVFFIIFLILITLPGLAFFSMRGGLSFLNGVDFRTANLLLFPLAGLYAFFFIWTQLMLGSNMAWLKLHAPNTRKFHKFEGGLALLFAFVHPLLLFIGVGFSTFLNHTYVAPQQLFFVWLGHLQILLIIATVGTALLRKLPWLRERWYVIHYANYLLFALVWVHSWFLGSDVQGTNLKYLWIFFGLTAVISTGFRIVRQMRAK